MATGDFNGDGKADLEVADAAAASVSAPGCREPWRSTIAV